MTQLIMTMVTVTTMVNKMMKGVRMDTALKTTMVTKMIQKDMAQT